MPNILDLFVMERCLTIVISIIARCVARSVMQLKCYKVDIVAASMPKLRCILLISKLGHFRK